MLLTGHPGCGKTTAIIRSVELIGRDACLGFYTEEIRERGRRTGFDVVLLDGRRTPLAQAGAGGPRVGRYAVRVSAFEKLAVECIESALTERPPGLLIVDEIGKMELMSRRFVRLLERIFDPASRWAVLGGVLRGRHPQVDRIRARPHVEILEVTRSNRDGLPGRLAERFRDYLSALADT